MREKLSASAFAALFMALVSLEAGAAPTVESLPGFYRGIETSSYGRGQLVSCWGSIHRVAQSDKVKISAYRAAYSGFPAIRISMVVGLDEVRANLQHGDGADRFYSTVSHRNHDHAEVVVSVGWIGNEFSDFSLRTWPAFKEIDCTLKK